jgi:hypothetical protein
VQQPHEALKSAKTVAVRAMKSRVMESVKFTEDVFRMIAELQQAHFEGAMYFGWLGAGAPLGQHEAARRAAAAAIKTSFME